MVTFLSNEISTISFNELEINEANPRHNVMPSSELAALSLIDDDIQDMIKLVNSFIENGFLPNLFIVIKKEVGDKYIALDGNRRLTALSLLTEKIILPDHKKYYNLKDTIEKNKISDFDFKLNCIVYNKEKDSISHIVSLHKSSGETPGQKKWTPLQQNRYADRNGLELDGWYLFAKKYLLQDSLENLKQPTTLDRIIKSKKFIETFKMDDQYKSALDDSILNVVSTTIISDLNADRINSRKMNKTEKINSYVTKLAEKNGVLKVENMTGQLDLLDSLNFATGMNSATEPVTDMSHSPISRGTTPLRETIIPDYIDLSGVNTKINYLNNDLRSLKFNKYKTTCAIALRVLIEMLTKLYLQKNDLKEKPELEKSSILHGGITCVLNDMRKKGLLSKDLHSQCSHYVNDGKRITFLNGCIHNLDIIPNEENLVEMFDTLEEYLKICAKQK